MTRPSCTCCFDRKVVPGILGEMRPCSRCQAEAFNAYMRERAKPKPKPPAKDGASEAGAE